MIGALAATAAALAAAPPSAAVDRVWRMTDPQQVLVEWHRSERVAPKGGTPYPNVVWRLVLVTDGKPFSVLTGPTVLNPIDDVQLVDLTRDGRLDVFVHDDEGNHGSGPTRIVATTERRPRVIFNAYWSETYRTFSNGTFYVDEPRGGTSVCCPDFRLLSAYRWNGRRLALVMRRLVPA